MQFTKPSKEPWLLRVCPTRHKAKLTKMGSLIGMAGYFAYFFGGFLAIIFGPIKFAMMEPEAPISRPIIWLLKTVGPTAFCIIYFSVMVAIAFTLMWGIHVYEYSENSQTSDDKLPKS